MAGGAGDTVLSLDDQLAEMWAAGATFTDIGLKLGESRGVIAGRIDRARRAGDVRFQPRPPKPKAAPKVRQVKPVGNVRSLHPPPSRPRTIAYLEIDECRWPVGQTAAGRTTFCGRKALQYPYCIDCAARARAAPAASLRTVANRPR
jgi:hypothetical protein